MRNSRYLLYVVIFILLLTLPLYTGVSLVELLNEIGGRNAIGRIDLVENRFVGIKSRGCVSPVAGLPCTRPYRTLHTSSSSKLIHTK